MLCVFPCSGKCFDTVAEAASFQEVVGADVHSIVISEFWPPTGEALPPGGEILLPGGKTWLPGGKMWLPGGRIPEPRGKISPPGRQVPPILPRKQRFNSTGSVSMVALIDAHLV